MSIKIQSPTLDTGEATALWKKISKNEASSFEDKCTFLSLFHSLSDDFDTDSQNFYFDILEEKANAKESLHKKMEHWHHTGPNPSVIDTIENSYSCFNNFVLWNSQSALQNEYLVTYMVKRLLKSGRIKESRTPFYMVNPLTVAKNSHKKPRFNLDLWNTQFFLFIRSEYSSTRELRRILWTTNVFLYEFGISEGYHHIDIDDNYQKKLGFSWKIDSKLFTLCSLFCSIHFYKGYALSWKKFGESKG